MGYDLHITRRKDWSAAGSDISSEEWLKYVEGDPELMLFPQDGRYFARWNGKSTHSDPWLDWFDGCIYSKNPDEALIDKMTAIARELQARVQGDDGEIYQSGHEPPIYPQPSILLRLGNWLRALRPAPRIKEIVPPFRLGDRVVDGFHKEATVTEIDPKSNHGLGKVKIRYDDGRELTYALAASGLTPLPNAERDR